MKKFLFYLLILFCFIAFQGLPVNAKNYQESLLADFNYRLSLPQTDVAQSQWYNNSSLDNWGPWPKRYPSLDNSILSKIPAGTNVTQWKRDRVVAVAKYYVGLPYMHHHIPAWNPKIPDKSGKIGYGLDCSNFSAWVYNIGFGIMLNSNVRKQAQMLPATNFNTAQPGMKKIERGQKLYPGDLLFIGSGPSHVAIYINENEVIDSIGTGVKIRPFSGSYKNYVFAVRIFN
ncbi:MAG TPA: NlpC/P60 family protein [Candidatus Gastranaerophilaceae bacterium]|nr:NlpC/P60 family protein [Candidatus Gastranaerophilaceae bacterium]HPT40820.1 NlpC/P60 family protein [Candidatus Gastranaerophilaceae bacterium]